MTETKKAGKLPVSKFWLGQELTQRALIPKDKATMIAEEVFNELEDMNTPITTNLMRALVCYKLSEHKLNKAQEGFVNKKLYYEKYRPIEN